MKNQPQEATPAPGRDDFHVVPLKFLSNQGRRGSRPYQNLVSRVPYSALSDAISMEKRYFTSALSSRA